MDYHAHIYFKPEQLDAVTVFRKKHLDCAPELKLWVSELVRKNVGPHPLPMFEVHVSTPTLEKYVAFVEKENPGLSILLHEDTGDDRRDHSSGARWFGEMLTLDFGFFDRLDADESLRVHPVKR